MSARLSSTLPALLAALLWAPLAWASTGVEVLELELAFDCDTSARRSVLLTGASEVLLEIPRDCPASGAEWKVSLSCAEDCSGKIRDAGGRTLGTFLGPRSALRLLPAQQQGPGAIRWVQVSGLKRLQAAAPEPLRDVPLTLTFRSDQFAASYQLDPSGTQVLEGPAPDRATALRTQVKALPGQKLQLQLWAGEDLVFRRTMSLNASVPVGCGVLPGWCQGTAKITLAPFRPQQLEARAED